MNNNEQLDLMARIAIAVKPFTGLIVRTELDKNDNLVKIEISTEVKNESK